MDDLGRTSSQSSDVGIFDAIRAAFTRIEAEADGGAPTGMMTGLADLDAKLCGVDDGDLVVVAGRPSMGKSSLAMQIAKHVARKQKRGAYVYSLEMPIEQLTCRSLCTDARVSYSDLKAKRVERHQWEHLTAAATELSQLPIVMAYEPGSTPALVRARCKRAASKMAAKGVRLGIVVIDYLGRMNVAGIKGKNGRHDQEIGEAVKICKGIAVDLKCVVVLVSQLNRALEKGQIRRPIMSDLRDSGEIEQDADEIIFVHRPEHYQQGNVDPKDRGIAELVIAKQRNGDTGVVRAVWFDKFTMFGDLDKSDHRYEADQ